MNTNRNAGRQVTEDDVRLPEFRGIRLDNLEFRDDGKVVRKDRWMMGMYRVAGHLGMSARKGFEIEEVVERIEKLMTPLSKDEIGEAVIGILPSQFPNQQSYDIAIVRAIERHRGIEQPEGDDAPA
jgi:hypothetical protein